MIEWAKTGTNLLGEGHGCRDWSAWLQAPARQHATPLMKLESAQMHAMLEPQLP